MKQSQSYKPAIVVPAYKRGKALELLLNSLNEAYYERSDIDLILSLEYESNEKVIRVAEEFNFVSGKKTILHHNEKLGLKNHIIKCADLSDTYGSVIILEEDLVVSPAFYHYSVEALNRYGTDDTVAGISLYAQRFNETAQLPFEPMPAPYPVYFMQLASSWGQAWTKNQWSHFKDWYGDGKDQRLISDSRLPLNIRSWPSTSWKKIFNHYLFKHEKYFVYPYQSLSSNNSHFGGENMKGTGNLFQVPMMSSYQKRYYDHLPDCNDAYIKYDAYMEPVGNYIKEVTGISSEELDVDLYGTKSLFLLHKKPHFITSKHVSNSEKKFPLHVKPMEQNLKYSVTLSKDGFFSLVNSDDLVQTKAKNNIYITLAHYFSYNRMDTKRFLIENLKQSFKNKF